MKKNRKQIGVIGVDSGMVMVLDPCYVESEYLPQIKKAGSRSAAFDLIKKGEHQINYVKGHAGLAVVSQSGWGDGMYPVFATYNEEGRVSKLEIEFL